MKSKQGRTKKKKEEDKRMIQGICKQIRSAPNEECA
jgi:hypothetical protein